MNEEYNFQISIKVVDDPSLKKIPELLPNTKEINIWFIGKRGTPHSNYVNYHLHSFEDLPKMLPVLKRIDMHYSNIPNFEDLTTKMPNLESISFDQCHIHNFHGFPKKHLSANHCTIDSFEGIPVNCSFDLEDCTIHSLGGVSRETLQAILVAILSKDSEKYDKDDRLRLKLNLKKDQHPQVRCTLALPPTALKLFDESIDHEIEQRYSPKYHENWPYIRSESFSGIPDYYIEEWLIYEENNEWEENWQFIEHTTQENDFKKFLISNYTNKKKWILGFGLEERLFIPEKLDRLHEYYRKTAQQLAQDYIAAPKNMPPELIERLVHEADPELRKMLENNLPPSDSVIKQISAKFSFNTKNGLKILK